MSVQSVLASDIAEGYPIQLLRISTTSGIYGEQDRPSDATSHETDENNYFQETQIEVPIERLVAEDEFFVECLEAVEPVILPSTRQRRSVPRWVSAKGPLMYNLVRTFREPRLYKSAENRCSGICS